MAQNLAAAPQPAAALATAGSNLSAGFQIVVTPDAIAHTLSVALKDINGNDPTPTHPLLFGFRQTGPAATIVRAVAGALSVLITSGGTMGVAAANTPFRLHVILIDNDGTPILGLINCLESAGVLTNVRDDGAIAISTTADNGSGGSDSAGVCYSTATVSNKLFRLLGHIDWNGGLSTPGTWGAVTSLVIPAAPGDPYPGDPIAPPKENIVTSSSTTTATIPYDDTIPQSNEGYQLASGFYAGGSPNVLLHEVEVTCSPNADETVTLALVATPAAGTVDALAAVSKTIKSGAIDMLKLSHRGVFNAGSGYELRIGTAGGATLTINGTAAARKLGGVLASRHRVTVLAG